MLPLYTNHYHTLSDLPVLFSELHCEVLPLSLELIVMFLTATNIKSFLYSLLGMIYLALFLVSGGRDTALSENEATILSSTLSGVLLLSELLTFHQ